MWRYVLFVGWVGRKWENFPTKSNYFCDTGICIFIQWKVSLTHSHFCTINSLLAKLLWETEFQVPSSFEKLLCSSQIVLGVSSSNQKKKSISLFFRSSNSFTMLLIISSTFQSCISTGCMCYPGIKINLQNNLHFVWNGKAICISIIWFPIIILHHVVVIEYHIW